MSKKQWFALLLLFLTYLILGATMFYFIESHYERIKIEKEREEREEINRKKIMMIIIAGIDYLTRIVQSADFINENS